MIHLGKHPQKLPSYLCDPLGSLTGTKYSSTAMGGFKDKVAVSHTFQLEREIPVKGTNISWWLNLESHHRSWGC